MAISDTVSNSVATILTYALKLLLGAFLAWFLYQYMDNEVGSVSETVTVEEIRGSDGTVTVPAKTTTTKTPIDRELSWQMVILFGALVLLGLSLSFDRLSLAQIMEMNQRVGDLESKVRNTKAEMVVLNDELRDVARRKDNQGA